MKPGVHAPEGGALVKRPPNAVDLHVGSRVRLRRMMIGLSQEKLGEKLGLTFQQVQKYEKGANRIGASRLYRMAEVLGVPIQFFFDGLPGAQAQDSNSGFGENGPTPYVLDFVSTAEGLQLNSAFSRISDPVVRRRIVELVKSLAASDPEIGAGSTPERH